MLCRGCTEKVLVCLIEARWEERESAASGRFPRCRVALLEGRRHPGHSTDALAASRS